MPHRTLSARLTIANGALVLAIIVLGASAIWGLLTLRAATLLAVDEYEEVQLLNDAGALLQRVRLELRLGDADFAAMRRDLEAARATLDAFLNYQHGEIGIEEEHQEEEQELARALRDVVTAVLERLAAPPADPGGLAALRAEVEQLLSDGTRRFAVLRETTDVSEVRESASRRAAVTAGVVASLSVIIVLGAIALSVFSHRRIVGGLRTLQEGVRRVASGRFAERVPERGDRELQELARDFNQMASELSTLYRVMEARIQATSRELVRSERLASVGFLAAGVAHEINNPLGIISGYAELAGKWLAGHPAPTALGDARAAVETIRDESFRCKKIVAQLMELSRAGDSARRPVVVGSLVREVLTLVRGLQRARDRTVSFESDQGHDIMVLGNEVELKQVLLNLIINALDATEPNEGRVRIALGAAGRLARLSVSDNGCGLSPDALEKVFEPFYSNRNGSDPGLGLGLTICHAIIESHGGHLIAESDGEGLGSRFVIELPQLDEARESDDDGE